MDAGVLILALAGMSGFAAAFAGVQAVQRAKRRSTASRISGGGESARPGGSLARILRNGVPALEFATKAVRRIGLVDGFVEDLSQWVCAAGVSTSANSLGSLLLAALAGIFLIASLVALSPVAGVAACALAIALIALRLQSWKQSQRDEVCEAVPEALSTMGECFQSGYSLVRTMEMVAHQAKGKLSVAFEKCADTLRMGGTTKEALASLQKIEGADELSFVAVALDVQHQSGGSIAAILAVTQEIVQDKVELRRDLRVQTAQARLSARVVCLMPFILVAVLSLVSEGFLSPFFSSLAGMVMLLIAILMEGAGIVLVRRMLRGVEQ